MDAVSRHQANLLFRRTAADMDWPRAIAVSEILATGCPPSNDDSIPPNEVDRLLALPSAPAEFFNAGAWRDIASSAELLRHAEAMLTYWSDVRDGLMGSSPDLTNIGVCD